MSVYYGIAFAASLVLTVICVIKHKGKKLGINRSFRSNADNKFRLFFLINIPGQGNSITI